MQYGIRFHYLVVRCGSEGKSRSIAVEIGGMPSRRRSTVAVIGREESETMCAFGAQRTWDIAGVAVRFDDPVAGSVEIGSMHNAAAIQARSPREE
jgi:hypothetical protein